jgi:hypothetical protein
MSIFLNTGLTGFPTKKSGPDPIEHCRTTPINKFQPGERPKTARRWMLLERGADVPGFELQHSFNDQRSQERQVSRFLRFE